MNCIHIDTLKSPNNEETHLFEVRDENDDLIISFSIIDYVVKDFEIDEEVMNRCLKLLTY